MKKLLKAGKLLVLAAISLLPASALRAETNPKPFTVPELKAWTGTEGVTTLSGRIIAKSSVMKSVAQQLAADYKAMTGKSLAVVSGKAKSGDIVLAAVKDKSLGQEGYTLTIGNSIEIEAATKTGAFWATRTLLQIAEQHKDGRLPKGKAVDSPEYGMRGFMLDCGRKYIPMNYLRNLVKIMGYYKMNTLQIHLNDVGFGQFFGDDWDKIPTAFRLECDTYPGLTATDGSYTKKEFIELQKLAEENGVEIIPEIDAPAHSLAFTRYKPEIGSKEFGMDHLDLFKQETYDFMDGLWKEYIGGKEPVFRGPRVHIGTDEYSNARKDVVEKFRYFTDYYIKFVESYGKQAVVWGSLTHAKGDTPVKSDNVLMHLWSNGYADPKEMKELGYKFISIPDGWVYIVPAAGYYYDYLNCQYLYEHYTPAVMGNTTFEENDPCIAGGMFAVWNDHTGNGISTKDIHHRAYPAMQTLAVKCWSGKHTTFSYDEFNSKRNNLSEGPGVNELGRLGKPGTVAFEKATVNAGEKLDVEEVGYDYAVTFTVDGKQEDKGTVLFKSANATVYISDPKQGKLGFERDGYRNLFNYRIPAGETHTITIEGNNRETRLIVDGNERQVLGIKPLYVVRESDRAHYLVEGTYTFEPIVYQLSEHMNYHQTLVFPLRQAGNFKSRITNLKVEMK